MTIDELIATLKANLNQTDIVLYPRASEQLIRRFEQEMHLVLPADFKTFYSFCNGFESAKDTFRFVPLEEILEYRHDLLPNQFYLAECLIYCDTWEVEISKTADEPYYILNLNTTLTNSLAGFLQRFLQGGVYNEGGLYGWREEIRNLFF